MKRAAAILTMGLAAAAPPAAQRHLLDTPLSHDPELAQIVRLRDGAATRRSDPLFTEGVEALLRSTRSAQVLGALPYTRPEQVGIAEARLLAQAKDDRTSYPHVSRAFEALVRRNRRLWRPSDETLAFLRRAATRELPGMEADDDQTAELGMAALSAAGVVDAGIVERVFGDEAWSVRRVAALALGAGGTRIDAARRTELIRRALRDRAWRVRLEAVTAWARSETGPRGCGPLVAALSDDSLHVVLAALDVLGDRCLDDVDLTDRVISEARAPPTVGSWHREAHAMVALAKRDPERAALSLPIFVHHPVWQVRMYAARAAAAMKDVYSLERLAYDAHDNVREAALPALRPATGAERAAACIAALGRRDYQLLRTVALILKDAPPDRYLLTALIDALARVTAEKKETSRDTRLAWIERIRAMAGRPHADVFERLLRDFDPVIAAAAADAYTALTGRHVVADPQRLPRRERLLRAEPPGPTIARVRLDTGRYFELTFDKNAAPLAYMRFRRLIESRYFDGLTFHRVVPNFVIQGGSPAANEYAGDDLFMMDELGRPHLRGTVGLSTRGRDTGDAQLFVNLVDNPRLDLEYTVFARVSPPHMDVVDEIQEGTTIRSMRWR